eukprot:scaffold12976_cov138-Isochrysis_galbana.AAC.2
MLHYILTRRSHGLVGYDACLTCKRSSVRTRVGILFIAAPFALSVFALAPLCAKSHPLRQTAQGRPSFQQYSASGCGDVESGRSGTLYTVVCRGRGATTANV